jgi:hypothetical protein
MVPEPSSKFICSKVQIIIANDTYVPISWFVVDSENGKYPLFILPSFLAIPQPSTRIVTGADHKLYAINAECTRIWTLRKVCSN